MHSSALFEIQTRHPLAGLETWPKTGPIYGFADDEPKPVRGFWARIGDRLRQAPDESVPLNHSRIWY